MKNVLIILFGLISFTNIAQKNSITFGEKISIDSKILNEKREIWIRLPQNYDWAINFENERFNVIYTLDAEDNFNSVSSIYESDAGFLNASFHASIIVGITNIDRNRDFIPEHNETPTDYCPSGKGQKFTEFIEKELIPYIDNKYATRPFRTFIGHSLGGLLATNILAYNSNLFKAFVIIDPSLTRYTENQYKALKETISSKDFKGISVYLAIANTIEGSYTINNVNESNDIYNSHIQRIIDFDNFIKRSNKVLIYQSKFYEDYDHVNSKTIAVLDGFRFIFKGYNFKFTAGEFENVSLDLIQKMDSHYENLSKKFNIKIETPLGMLNVLSYSAMKNKQFELAGMLFKRNVETNPEFWNFNDSYGDYFKEIGDYKNAKVYYEKALKLNNYPETKSKLKEVNNLLKK